MFDKFLCKCFHKKTITGLDVVWLVACVATTFSLVSLSVGCLYYGKVEPSLILDEIEAIKVFKAGGVITLIGCLVVYVWILVLRALNSLEIARCPIEEDKK